MVNTAVIGGTGFSDSVKNTAMISTDYGKISVGTIDIGGRQGFDLQLHPSAHHSLIYSLWLCSPPYF